VETNNRCVLIEFVTRLELTETVLNVLTTYGNEYPLIDETNKEDVLTIFAVRRLLTVNVLNVL